MQSFSAMNWTAISYTTVLLFVLATGRLFPQTTDLSKVLINKDTVRILVTDSGLGGYSVAAGIDSVLSANKTFRHAQIIFCNALPKANFRYNELPDAQTKANVFSSVLYKMQNMFKPDVLLIACNTLSVVYPLTDFAKTTKTPVIGIVELGVKAITDSLNQNSGSCTIILGTETTIQSAAHKDMLIKNNIAPERIYTEACPNLESEIQVSPSSDMVAGLIEFYLDEIPKQNENKGDTKTFAALCCTHYGFAKSFFDRKLRGIYPHVEIINPNDEMINLFAFKGVTAAKTTEISVSVYSQAELSAEEKQGIGKLITPVSSRAGESLEKYILLNGIF